MYRTYKDVTDMEKITSFQNEHVLMFVQNREHRNELIKKNGLLCIRVWSEKSEQSKAITNPYKALAQEYSGIATFVDEHADNGICSEIEGIDTIPTFLIFFRGRLANKVGGVNLDEVRRTINAAIEQVSKQSAIASSAPVGYASRGGTPLYRKNYGDSSNPETHRYGTEFTNVFISPTPPTMDSLRRT